MLLVHYGQVAERAVGAALCVIPGRAHRGPLSAESCTTSRMQSPQSLAILDYVAEADEDVLQNAAEPFVHFIDGSGLDQTNWPKQFRRMLLYFRKSLRLFSRTKKLPTSNAPQS